jgi:hypothetical protein
MPHHAFIIDQYEHIGLGLAGRRRLRSEWRRA